VARDHVGECRPWPQHFREKKALCGLAAAAIVSVPKNNAEGEVRATGLHSSRGIYLLQWVLIHVVQFWVNAICVLSNIW
jgi:hypothetical protein